MKKKIIALLVCVMMVVSLVPFAASAKNVSTPLDWDKFGAGAGWVKGEDGYFMQASDNYGDPYPVYDDPMPTNSVTMTFTIPDIGSLEENFNLMIAAFCKDEAAGCAEGYCIDYYPSAGKFDINYGDKGIDDCIVQTEGYVYSGNSMTVTAFIDNGIVGVIYDGKVVLATNLNEGDNYEDFKWLSGWQYFSGALVSSYEFTNAVFTSKTVTEMTAAKWTAGTCGWDVGTDGFILVNNGNYDTPYPFYADARNANGTTMTFTIENIKSVPENGNLMVASFSKSTEGGAADGYCIDYYPSAGKFDINYGDQGIDNCIVQTEGYVYSGDSMTVSAYIDNGGIYLVVNGELILFTALNEGDVADDFKYVSGWQWESTAKVSSYAFANISAGLEQEAEKEAPATGDNTVIAIAAIAVVALAGSAVVLRKKEN